MAASGALTADGSDRGRAENLPPSLPVDKYKNYEGREKPSLGGKNMVLSFIAGGAAGALAKTMIAPLDRVKIIFQISNMPFNFAGVAKEISRTYKDEGFRALFKGNAAQIARVYPYSGIQLMAFDQYSRMIASLKHSPGTVGGEGVVRTGPKSDYHYRLTPVEKLICGAGAGGTSVLITYPLDLMRARIAVQRETGEGALKHEGLLHAFQRMYKGHGFRNFYRGIGPTLGGIVPYAAISFTTFETTKHWVADRTGEEPSHAARLVCGGLSGLTGQMATYPLDIVRRRLQTEGFSPIHAHSKAVYINPHRTPAKATPTLIALAEMAASAARGVIHSAVGSHHHHPFSSAASAAPVETNNNSSHSSASTSPASVAGAKSSSSGSGISLAEAAVNSSKAAAESAAAAAASTAGKAAAEAASGGQEFAAHRLTAAATIRHIVETDGWRGLYKGFSMNLIKGPLGVGISFTFYDFLKRSWGVESFR